MLNYDRYITSNIEWNIHRILVFSKSRAASSFGKIDGLYIQTISIVYLLLNGFFCCWFVVISENVLHKIHCLSSFQLWDGLLMKLFLLWVCSPITVRWEREYYCFLKHTQTLCRSWTRFNSSLSGQRGLVWDVTLSRSHTGWSSVWPLWPHCDLCVIKLDQVNAETQPHTYCMT